MCDNQYLEFFLSFPFLQYLIGKLLLLVEFYFGSITGNEALLRCNDRHHDLYQIRFYTFFVAELCFSKEDFPKALFVSLLENVSSDKFFKFTNEIIPIVSPPFTVGVDHKCSLNSSTLPHFFVFFACDNH